MNTAISGAPSFCKNVAQSFLIFKETLLQYKSLY